MFKFTIVLLLIAGLVVGFVAFRGGEEGDEIHSSTVTTGPLTFAVETLGTLEPLTEVIVSCEATGKIVEILKDFDDEVAKDEVICRIDPELVNAQHAQSIAELERTKSAVQEARITRDEQLQLLPMLTERAKQEVEGRKAALEMAEFDYSKKDELYKKNQAPKAEWLLAKTGFEQTKAALKSAETAHQQAQNNERFLPPRLEQALAQAEAAHDLAQALFDTTKAQVEKCTIRSPIDGLVLTRYLDVGTTVNPTLQPPPLFKIAPHLDRMRVSARVSESDIAHIEVGQNASFTVEGRQRTKFQGTILEKRNQPDIIQGVTTYTVILEVRNDERRTLLPGMSVNVVIECVHYEKATKIANKALRFRPPLTMEERQEIIEKLEYPAEPMAPGGATADYSDKGVAWHFDEVAKTWKAIPLWVGITDNIETQIIAGAKPGDSFVDTFIDNTSKGFSLKDAIRMASPGGRSL